MQCGGCERVGTCNNCVLNDRVPDWEDRVNVKKCSGTFHGFVLCVAS